MYKISFFQSHHPTQPALFRHQQSTVENIMLRVISVAAV